MSLYEEWNELLNNQTEATLKDFWEEYATAEKTIYAWILTHMDQPLTGTVKELSEKFSCRPVIFTGFLDGVQASLKEGETLKPEDAAEDMTVSISVDPEKLYYNMEKAEATHLSSLPEWDGVLSAGKRAELEKTYKRSKIYHAPKKPGRNDPCPCGSGKKYKNCCGRNA